MSSCGISISHQKWHSISHPTFPSIAIIFLALCWFTTFKFDKWCRKRIWFRYSGKCGPKVIKLYILLSFEKLPTNQQRHLRSWARYEDFLPLDSTSVPCRATRVAHILRLCVLYQLFMCWMPFEYLLRSIRDPVYSCILIPYLCKLSWQKQHNHSTQYHTTQEYNTALFNNPRKTISKSQSPFPKHCKFILTRQSFDLDLPVKSHSYLERMQY